MNYGKHVLACQPVSALKVDRHWWLKALDFILPPCCVLCGQPSGPACICNGCRTDLPWHGPQCLRCGLPLGSPKDKICGTCIQSAPPYFRTICPLQYEFPVNHLVQGFKFRRQLAAGRILSHLTCDYVRLHKTDLPDALVPVPLHRFRMISRGFNQAYELAGYMGKVLDIPVLASTLRRRRNTRAQSGLSRKQRRRNMRGAFYWHGSAKPPRHIALVDDVMTTGTTVGECALVLKRAGAKRVDVWVTARAIPAGHRGGN